VIDDLLWGSDVPYSKRAFAAVADGGGEHSLSLNSKLNRLELLFGEKGNGKRRFHHNLLGISREEKESAEHVLIGLNSLVSHLTDDMFEGRVIYLVVTSTEDEFGVGIEIENTLDNLALITCQHIYKAVDLRREHTLLTAMGRTSRFFFPTRTAEGLSYKAKGYREKFTGLQSDVYEQGCSLGDLGIDDTGRDYRKDQCQP
jgi:hypothetical protein